MDTILKTISDSIGRLLKVEPAKLDLNGSFLQLGVNSVLGVDLIVQLSEELGVDLGVEAIFDYRGPRELAEYVAGLLDSPSSTPQSAGGILNYKALIVEEIARMLKLKPADVDPRESFLRLGVNSVLGVDLINRLNEISGEYLGVEAIFDYRSPAELAEVLQGGSVDTSRTEVSEYAPSLEGDVAVIGVSGRFPGAESVDEFWMILENGDITVRDIQRVGFDQVDMRTPKAGLLESAHLFDPLFFNISPKEAERMDPQQRLLLEECYKAVEDSGIAPSTLAGQPVGVFVGARSMDFMERLLETEPIKPQTFLGNDMSILSGRVAYFLDLKGPVATIDTACSSSLAALHLAIQSIRRGESRMALAAGVFVMPTPRFFTLASSIDMLSPSGQCRAFDQQADGMVVAEGAAALFLKSSLDLGPEDRVYALIKGSGMNHNGRTQGITAPSSKWQQQLLETVYKDAGVDPATLGYVEAQGGGTKLGDPIELAALSATFRSFTDKRGFCAVGSHKSNIGHAMAAAGMAGVCKVLMAIQHRSLPPSVGIDEVNRHIDLGDSPFYINRELRPWNPVNGYPLRAGVTAFGFNGTNCHVIFEEAPNLGQLQYAKHGSCLVPLSAPTESGLKRRIDILKDWLENGGGSHSLVEIAATLQLGRDHFPVRAAFVAGDMETLKRQLADFQPATVSKPAHLLSESGSSGDGLSRLAEQYIAGESVDWSRLYPGGLPKKISLPPYPFERLSFWPGNRAAESMLERAIDSSRPPLMEPALPDRIDEALRELQRLTEWSLFDAYQRMGVMAVAGETYTAAALKRELAIIDRYDRLFHAHLGILQRAGFIHLDAAGISVLPAIEEVDLKSGLAELDSLRQRIFDQYPEIRPYVKLLGICTAKYPEILTGATPATEVMFPNYSMELMEDIYRGNPVADYYNTLAAWSIRSFIEARIPQLPAGGKIGIVEIGAGTGGTSKPVFAAIQEFAPYLDYYYTDISLAFTKYGRKQYGDGNPYVKFQLLDVEKDVAEQGFIPGEYDIVLATNVFHATRDIRRTLRQSKLLLKKNGWVVANELTGVLDVFTVNFGLLEGWWLYEDGDLRLPDSPLLDSGSWSRVLQELGYSRVSILGQPKDDRLFIPQNVVIGESDGILPRESSMSVVDGELPAGVRGEVIGYLVRTLGVREADIQADRPFSEYGVDSIIGVELINEINAGLGVSLKTTDLFDFGTVNELSDAIVRQLGAPQPELSGRETPVAATSTDIAVIGLSCRFAGARNAAEFWRNLSSGVCSITEVPVERWDWRVYYGGDNDNPDKTNSKWGGFLEDIDLFDPLFFNISGKEAELSDPQQRILLEECYHALEEAGYSGSSISNTRCGVFVGVITGDYLDKMDRDGVPLDAQSFWGTASSITAARISYFLNLKGPSVAVDTACSSSLVALHLGCRSLLAGDSEMVVSGGVFITVTPRFYILTGNSGMLSPTGVCRPFDDGADGFVPGEGAGAVVLKPLERALTDNDHIYGVVKGSGINQDGKTNGITAPSTRSQSDLEISVYRRAGISADTIGYVEAHGTGTRLGDPIEVEALTRAFRRDTNRVGFCALGSLKANVGHTSGAAGIAGVIKALLSMTHGKIPPNIHFEQGNVHIDLAGSPFYVNTQLKDWRPGGPFPRRATVSAFGFSGTNAHVLLEEPPDVAAEVEEAGPYIVVLSARSHERLRLVIAHMVEYVNSEILEKASPLDDGRPDAGSVKQELLSIAADILDIDPTVIDPSESLREAGFDRLGLTELDTSIQQRFGVQLPPDMLAEYPSPLALAREICAGPREVGVDLGSVAFTLQVGREHMAERLAVVTDDAEHLLRQLRSYLDGEKNQRGIYTGNASEQQGKIDFLLDGDDGCEIVQRLVSKRRFDKLARLWSAGAIIDWQALYPGRNPRRVSLPLYPFARNRYWYSASHRAGAGAEAIQIKHPLMDTVRLDRGLDGTLTFVKRIGPGDAVMADHRVGDKAILPGVAYLEMALASAGLLGQRSGHSGLASVVWLRPLTAPYQSGAADIMVSVTRGNGAPKFEIHRDAGEDPTLHARGEIESLSKESRGISLDLEMIQTRCSRIIEQDELYSFFTGLGIDYGPFFRGLERVWRGDDEALGEVSLPGDRGNGGGYLLHPGLADSALQTILTISGSVVLPFALERLRVIKPLSGRLYAYAKKEGDNRYNVAIAAEDGTVCATFHDLAVRPPHKPIAPFYYIPHWRRENSPAAGEETVKSGMDVLIVSTKDAERLAGDLAEIHRNCTVHTIEASSFTSDASLPDLGSDPLVYFLGLRAPAEDDDLAATFEDCQATGVMALFRLARRLCDIGRQSSALRMRIVTNNVFRLKRGDSEVVPFMASVHGLARSMAEEFFHWSVDCIDIDYNEVLPGTGGPARWLAAPLPPNHGEWALRKGVLWQRGLSPVQLPEPVETRFKAGGVYVIVGGAGGIGLELALHAAVNVKAKLVLTGRSELSSLQMEKVSHIEQAGGEVLYLRADAGDQEAMKRVANAAIERFEKIDGVVHSAIVLQDRLLENMDEETLLAALVPKTNGSVVLYEVFKDMPLDFMLFFSSAQSFIGNKGQANYAAACTFKDAFAHYIAIRSPFDVKVVNWGYWGSVGIVSSPEYQRRLAALGAYSITPAEGMEAIERVLAGPHSQVVSIKASQDLLCRMGAGEDMNAGDIERTYGQVDRYTRLSLLRTFRRVGLFKTAGERTGRENLIEELKIVPSYHRLLDALLAILREAGFIVWEGEEIVTAAAAVNAKTIAELEDLERTRQRLLEEIPEFSSHLNLLDHCLEAYPGILDGSRGHMEVLFPDGKRDMVEGIYKGNIVIDFYNRLVASAVSRCVDERLGRRPGTVVKILEVGAGTGGTTEFVCRALKDHSHSIKYYYTDISSGFTRAAKKRFGERFPFMLFQPLDIQRDPHEQGFEAQGMDLVFGSNVLHATADMNRTLQNARILLKSGGRIVINEITKLWDFATVTFGLTDGWWLYQDIDNRIEGSPLISAEVWRRLLAENGFDCIRWFGVEGLEEHLQEQCVFQATNKGDIVRAPLKKAAPIVETVLAEPASGGSDDVEKKIKQLFADVLRIDSSVIDRHSTFETYGVDSLVNLELTKALGHQFGKLPNTLLFEYKTIAQLAAYLAKKSPAPQEVAITRAPETNGDKLRRIRELVRNIFAGILKISPNDLDGGSTFETFGVDSLVTLEIGKALSAAFGKLPSTLLFEYKTIDTLAEYLAGEYDVEWNDTPGAAKPQDAGMSIERLFDASVAEVETTPAAATLQRFERGDGEIAVIGVTGRYPQADNMTQFWENLSQGKDCITPAPEDREALVHAEVMVRGGFIDGVDLFDPLFFNISPAEARTMDPQERLFLETVWELLEESNVTPGQLAGEARRTGVFVGVMNNDYNRFGAMTHYSSIANRVSYYFDFQGPSIAVDTSCSSSLTAVHLACESLKTGQCDAAVAGGVNLILHPDHFQLLNQKRMLSETGACRSFDAAGDGFVVGEGVGAVLLTPLDRAVRENNEILAIIKGSAANAGGKTGGYMTPNPTAQTNVVVEALTRAGVAPETVGYIEAQATGSPIADAIEFTGLSRAFASLDSQTRACAIGSVKTNIGHLESASGIAGLTKVILQMRYRTLVPTLYGDGPNPDIDFDNSPFYLQRDAAQWRSNGPRRAGISSFGAGGANAHVIVEEYVGEPESNSRTAHSTAPQVLVLSARQPETLKIYAANMAAYLEDRDLSLEEVAYTLQTGRQAMKYRLAIIASALSETVAYLKAFAANEVDTSSILGGDTGDGSLLSLARAWVDGRTVDWKPLYGTPAPRKVHLTTYPFRKKRYWLGEKPVEPAPEYSTGSRDNGMDVEEISAAIVEVVSSVLEIGTGEFDREAPFTDFGVDSITAVTIVQQLNRRLSVQLRDTDLFNYPSIDTLTQHVVGLERGQPQLSMLDLFRKLQKGEVTAQQTEQLLESQTW
jgi:acyl transferase domain-containing protein/SAM-dependent methyltransferase